MCKIVHKHKDYLNYRLSINLQTYESMKLLSLPENGFSFPFSNPHLVLYITVLVTCLQIYC